MRRRLTGLMAALLFGWAGAAQSAQVPRPAPEFVIMKADGTQELLSKYRGKVVVMEILLTTCPHCQSTSQILSRLHTELGPKGFQPLGVAIDPMAKLAVPDFIQRFGVNYPVGYAERDPVINFLQHPPMMRMLVPQLVIIDRNGVIVEQHSGDSPFFQNEEANLRNSILKLLAQRAPAPRAKPGAKPAAATKASQ